MIYSSFIPRKIRRWFFRMQHGYKYDVSFGKNAFAKNSVFEGKNILREKAALINGYMGFGSYISENTVLKNIKIGRYSCIGPNVSNFYGRHPSGTFVSIHPAFYSPVGQAGFTFVNKRLFVEHKYVNEEKKIANVIGNDVWVGCNVILMDGVSIGDGAIVAAGSIVTKDVEPYSIVGGIPAKLIKKRFTEQQITKLLQKKWWNQSFERLKLNAIYFKEINLFLEKYNSEKNQNI